MGSGTQFLNQGSASELGENNDEFVVENFRTTIHSSFFLHPGDNGNFV